MALPRPIRLMVVDDIADMRLLARSAVEDGAGGIEVVAEADGGSAAIAALAEAAPDVVLVDARMPLMDGYETAAALLAARPDLRIILVSAYVDDEIEAAAASVGIAQCLDKGRLAELPAIVRRVAGGA